MACVGTFTIRRGDTAPALRLLLEDSDGVVPPLTGATARIHLVDTHGTLVVDRPATLFAAVQLDPSGDEYNFEYPWLLSDTDREPQTLRGEVEVTFVGGQKSTFPSRARDEFRVKIVRALG